MQVAQAYIMQIIPANSILIRNLKPAEKTFPCYVEGVSQTQNPNHNFH